MADWGMKGAISGNVPVSFSSTSSGLIFSQNVGAKLRTFANDSNADLYLILKAMIASTTVYHIKIPANGGFFTTDYTGEVRGIMSAAVTSGQVNCGEFT